LEGRADAEDAVVVEEDIIAFIRAHLGSLYALDLLLLIKRDRNRSWQPGELVRELRSSQTAVAEALSRLVQAELVTEKPPGSYRFAPTSPERERLASEIERVYTSKPIRSVEAIATAGSKVGQRSGF
jgi:DNA-binding transcriptional ArsR family regulator